MKIKKMIFIVVLLLLFILVFCYAKNNLTSTKLAANVEVSSDDETNITVTSDNRLIEESLKSKLTDKLIISENEIEVEHRTDYSETIPLSWYHAFGSLWIMNLINNEATISKTGKAIVQYEYVTDLSKCEIKKSNDNITIYINEPYLNENSVKIKEGSFKLDKGNSAINTNGTFKIIKESIINSETIDAKASRKLMDEIPTLAKEKIKQKEDQNDLNNKAIDSVQKIVDEILVDKNTNLNIFIKIKM